MTLQQPGLAHSADPATLSPASAESLARLKSQVGAIPNLARRMADAPVLIDAFVTLRERFHEHATLPRPDRELVFLSNAVENGCRYCTAIHTAFALKEGVSSEAVEAVRAGRLPEDRRLAALVGFARILLRQRGRVTAEELDHFCSGGYTAGQALELIAAAAMSTLANFAGRFTQAPLDDFLEAHRVIA